MGMCEKNGALNGKEGDGNESTWEKEERKVKDDIKEKGLSADEVYGRALEAYAILHRPHIEVYYKCE